MGANLSNLPSMIDPVHIRIYSNILQIQNIQTRVQMIQTCLSSQEYIISAKKTGIYSHLLAYVAAINNKKPPPLLPFSVTETNTNIVVSNRSSVSFFSKCLEILNIREEVELDEETLKNAYKKVALRVHPDKGGSEEQFQLVTKAYQYLLEIIKRVRGNRKERDTPSSLTDIKVNRNEEIDQYKYEEPTRIDPNNININVFNKFFDENKISEPDQDGYGDWLKSCEQQQRDLQKPKNPDTRIFDEKSGSKLSNQFDQKFSREVFNRMFESEEQKTKHEQKSPQNSLILHPDSMALVPDNGTELGRERPNTYTAPFGSKSKFTDLKDAYTDDSTITHKVHNLLGSRQHQSHPANFEKYKASREGVPNPLTGSELEQLTMSEKELKEREKKRQRRYAEEGIFNQDYFDRMKRQLIVDK